jgi:hypothetical protein
MATPIENAQTLLNYWKVSGDKAALDQFTFLNVNVNTAPAKLLYGAREAMKELVSQSQGNTYVRSTVFAAQNIFSTALLAEPAGYTDDLLKRSEGNLARAIIGGSTPPRLIMLDGIYGAGTGGFFAAADPSGITSWLGSEDVSLAGMAVAISTDVNPAVRAAALRIVGSLGLPARWVQRPPTPANTEPKPTQLEQAIKTLQATLSSSPWDQATRKGLSDLAERALGRLDSLAFVVAAAEAKASAAGGAPFSAFPSFPTGNGASVATVPPAPKPWYRNGQVIGAGMIAAIGGAVYAKRQRA